MTTNHHLTTARRRGVATLSLVVALGLAGTACSDEADSATTSTTAVPPSAPATPDEPGDDEPTSDGTETLKVVLEDYAFQDLPASVPAGTRLTVVNEAERELHELVAIRLADDEDRTADELAHDPDALGALLTSGPPATVLLAAPGGEQIPAVGDGTLSEPGRYLLICMIPSGVDPDVYLEAAAQSDGGPPQVEGGPPHVAHGMFAELVVE